ncbi:MULTISPECIES: hypothetical protein [unclassified Sphingomonas]|mgnify:FL=1|uniref:hypothetical protein n=1 Tax=Sphingomonas TaxID=13687 RepID=UPI000968FC8E|nr:MULTISPECIES: hypothetical protein [unclassified Sphingomonas]MBN8810704.1 hypothetical protein [Sphingomonas sp.]OJY49386.1 MAG: hypothetical protein BGP17_12350 [Sphingomonas sp. 67-41]
MTGGDLRANRRWWWAICAIAVAGLALRFVCSLGDLWFDEAWSASQARDALTPIGVFIGINHDNNHHLNSLWMQMVGFGAWPPLVRLLSILSSSAAILVAARIAEPRGRITMVATALLFAFSPMLVTMGSEARGYAGMSLAMLIAILFIDRWLAGDLGYRRPTTFALCFFLGALSQLTMIFAAVALVGWPSFVLWKRNGFRAAALEIFRTFWLPVLVLAGVLGFVLAAGHFAGTGFRFGRYDPFDFMMYLNGTTTAIGYTIGLPWKDIWPIVLVLVLLVLAPRWGASRMALYRLAIFAFPFLLAVLHAGNVGHARYYMPALLPLLLMLGEMIGFGLEKGDWRRIAAGIGLAAMLGGSLWCDYVLAVDQRGDPGGPVREMMARAPEGTTMLLDRDTGQAATDVAAARRKYKLKVILGRCDPQARFLLVDRFLGEAFPADADRCGGHFALIAQHRMRSLSGTNWNLYERRSQP